MAGTPQPPPEVTACYAASTLSCFRRPEELRAEIERAGSKRSRRLSGCAHLVGLGWKAGR